MKYRKRPIVVEAIQWTGFNLEDVYEFTHPEEEPLRKQFIDPEFIGYWAGYDQRVKKDGLELILSGGKVIKANIGDFIIKENNGDCYRCPSETFVRIYEEEQ